MVNISAGMGRDRQMDGGGNNSPTGHVKDSKLALLLWLEARESSTDPIDIKLE